MKLAFCLFNYFPYGGLQRDFFRIAQLCRQRGHNVHIYTMSWEGELDPGFHIYKIQAKGLQNHTRVCSFIKQLKAKLTQQCYDLVIGFNKMPYLDIYYAADTCYQARMKESRRAYHRLLPRYQHWLALEKAVFDCGNRTKIMLISPKQQSEFVRYYQTENHRFHFLPPGIAKDRIATNHAITKRANIRKAFAIEDQQILFLMIASAFKTKGVDRTIKAMSQLPQSLRESCHLFVIGNDNPKPFKKLAGKMNLTERIHFLGGRSDVADFLAAGDFLLHPAYHDNTGTVLLEAMVSGLPVLTVDSCGYAHYVSETNCGVVLSSPFKQVEFNRALEKMIVSPDRKLWRQNGLRFSKHADIYDLPEKAVNFIESVGDGSESLSS